MSESVEAMPEPGRGWLELRSWRLWLSVLAGCTVLGLLEGTQVHIGFAAAGRPAEWGHAFASTMPWWYVLAALLPAVLWLSRRFALEGSRWRRNTLVHVTAGIVFAGVHLVVSSYISQQLTYGGGSRDFAAYLSRLLGIYFIVEIIFYWAIVGVDHAIDYAHRLRERERAAAQLALKASRLEAGLARANLESLRMQINPHFLFNTLNAISVLALKGEKHTVVRTLALLSDLLRISLEHPEQLVPLRDEISFLQRYLEIEQTRFKDRLTVRLQVPDELLDAEVPSLVLQPLVENAIRHGIAQKPGAGRIDISATARAGRLELVVQDNGAGLRPVSEDGGMGIGLANTRARLEQLYGDEYEMVLENAPEGGARTCVCLPLRMSVAEPVDERALRDARSA
ncbi:MAG TPA: sensor histidine kinase [Longimicrobiales bacterium]|nr:sensor histidine kinase [Longimicrobiales bacterium]